MSTATQKLCVTTTRTIRATALLFLSIFWSRGNLFVRGAANNRSLLNSRAKTIIGSLKLLDWRGGAETVIVREETVHNNDTTDGNKATDDIMTSPTKAIQMVFSDVDGTLAHYPDNLDDFRDDEFVKFPASSTGMRGIISRETLRLCHKIRQTKVADPGVSEKDATNVKFTVVSGMRTTTLLQRLPYLPLADAYCSENGGRIFYPILMSPHEVSLLGDDEKGKLPNEFYPPEENEGDQDGSSSNQMYRLQEDMDWRQMMSSEVAAGPDGYHSKSPALAIPVDSRRGVLWDFASDLVKRGWVLDHRGYATGFRVHMKKQVIPTLNADYLKKEAPSSLSVTENLGSYDVYPSCCGKKNVCAYLADKLCGVALSSSCICFCDDDNDIDMALGCKYAFLPSLTSDSIQTEVNAHPSQLFLATSFDPTVTLGTTSATDVMIRAALKLCESGVLQTS